MGGGAHEPAGFELATSKTAMIKLQKQEASRELEAARVMNSRVELNMVVLVQMTGRNRFECVELLTGLGCRKLMDKAGFLNNTCVVS